MTFSFPGRTIALVVALFIACCIETGSQALADVAINFTLPKAALVTIAIDDAQGNRVRNLVAEKQCAAGAQKLAWDGLDDTGKPVAPGKYSWRGLYHDQLKLEYQFSVYDGNASPPWFTTATSVATSSGWLSDHHPPCSVACIGDKVFVGAIVCENGQDLMALDRDGNKLWGIAHPGNGAGASVLCADDKFVYGAGEAQWAGDNAYVFRVDAQTYKVEVLWHHKGRLGLRGIAARDGKVYVASDLESKIFVLDAASKKPEAKPLREIALPAAGGLGFSPGGKLLAISGQSVMTVNEDGTSQLLVRDHLSRPNRIAVGTDGTIYVSDGPTSWYHDDSVEANTLYGAESVRFKGDNQVKVFDAQGNFLRAIGTPGGRKPGPYDPQAMRCPIGLALDSQNRLWVAEYDMLPKRISVWNSQTGALEKEFIGGPKYGGGGALDPGDRTQMIYDGMLFKLDWTTGAWKLTDTIVPIMNVESEAQHTLGGYGDWPSSIIRYQGQQYFSGGGTLWQRKGDTFLPIAHVGPFQPSPIVNNEPNKENFLYGRMIEVLGEAPPGRDTTDVGGPPGKWNNFVSFLMLWTDTNGDGIVQPSEVNFSDKPYRWLAQPSIGPDLAVYLRNPTHRNVTNAWRLPLTGLNERGAPIYDIAKLETVAQNMPDTTGGAATDLISDGVGHVFTLGRPLYGFDLKTHAFWSYPNPWPQTGDGAPRAQPGLVIAGWGLRGATNVGGELGSLLAVNSDFGQWYLFTGDGLFVSTLFGDTRTSPFWGTQFKTAQRGMNAQGVSLGQESFFGWMGRSSDGNVYIVAGHAHCSIIKVVGLDSVKRLAGGNLSLNAPMISEGANTRTTQNGLILHLYGGNFGNGAPTTIIKSGETEVARVWLAYDGNNLKARFKVLDASPLLNAGTDPKLLFKTGDSVDLQLGLDTNAAPKHTSPLAGDVRLLLTKTKDGAMGVLYRYKTAGSPTPQRFWSPTGEVLVDKIEVLSAKDLTIETATDKDGYVLTATIPWKLLAGAEYEVPVGGALRGDVGVLFSDPGGATTVERVYNFNTQTGIVADVPSEIRLHPDMWGTWKFMTQ